jgi:phosphoketolase
MPSCATFPDFRDYAVDVTAPGAVTAESTRVMGGFLRDVMKLNLDSRNFRVFSPDESNSNRWQDVLEVTNRAWVAETEPWDDHLAPDGRVMEMLSEHLVPGLAGRVSPNRPARFLLLLRGLHPHHRFDVQTARQMAEGLQ